MKLNVSFAKKEANIEADVERLVEKKIDLKAKNPDKKTRYQIRQEEKRLNKEQKFRQSMIMIGAYAIFMILLIILIPIIL